jgi:hypothetical protein
LLSAGAAQGPAGSQFPYDGVLLVGGRPDGLEVPSLDMALRARTACELLIKEKKAYYLLVSGKEYNNKRRLEFDPIGGSKVDRSKEERIRSGEMLALIARARGIGRLAMRLRADPLEVAALCQAKGWKKILCVGDGNGPEKPAVDKLKAQGAQVDFVAPYSSLEEGKKLLSQDFKMTTAERAQTNLDEILKSVKPADVDILLVKGGPDDSTTRALTAIRLYQMGIGKHINVAGGAESYLSLGEVVAITCGGFGIPIEHISYCPDLGDNPNYASVVRWAHKHGVKNANVIVTHKSGPVAGFPKDDVRFRQMSTIHYQPLWPPDQNTKMVEILAELRAEIAKWEKLAKTGTAKEKALAKEKLDVIGDGRWGQARCGLFNMTERGRCGRFKSFPDAPWDWDGVSPHASWASKVVPFAVYRTIFGAQVNFVLAGGLENVKRHLIQDYGARGPWQEYMDVQMKVPANMLDRIVETEKMKRKKKMEGQ